MRTYFTFSNVDFEPSVHEIVAIFGPTAKADRGVSKDEAMGINL